MLLSRRSRLAIVAVVDIAAHSRSEPVTAKSLASRHELSPRHLEAVLQALVRGGILRSGRGPRGGYGLARERRRVSLGDVLRAVDAEVTRPAMSASGTGGSTVAAAVEPVLAIAARAYLRELDGVSLEELCQRVGGGAGGRAPTDFTI